MTVQSNSRSVYNISYIYCGKTRKRHQNLSQCTLSTECAHELFFNRSPSHKINWGRISSYLTLFFQKQKNIFAVCKIFKFPAHQIIKITWSGFLCHEFENNVHGLKFSTKLKNEKNNINL